MKKTVLIVILVALIKIDISAQYPDLPGGGGNYNVQTLPTGSYVIAMDNKYQASGAGVFNITINNRAFNYTIGNPIITAVANTTGILVGMGVTGQGAIPAGTTVTAVTPTTVTLSLAPTATQTNKALDFGYRVYSGEDFNLRAYGLLVTLLNNNIKLKWVIKPGKAKDANDFSVNATRIKPSLGPAAATDFAGGPFVIFAQDTAGVANLVQTFNGSVSADDVKLYRTNAGVPVDIRYDYYFNTSNSVWKPKAAILDDGGNAQIHEKYMVNAGVPTSNYTVESSAAFITNCYTFASEPHNSSAPNSVIQGIRTFIENGSNFLAQCDAVNTYEFSTLARFQSTNGFTDVNGGPDTWTYSNSDLAYFQINGYFGIADEGGSLQDWEIPVAPGNPPVNNFHVHTRGTKDGIEYTNASVSKLRPSSDRGGLVFYLGSHDYDGNDDYNINGQRLYLNALMVPTQSSLRSAAVLNCTSNVLDPVSVNCSSGSGPSFAYPLTFTLYHDLAPSGYNAGDPQLGNIVTMTAPNTYQDGISQITAPNNFVNYLIVTRAANGCQPNTVFSSCTVLSVELLSFSAVRNGAMVDLKWSTASEENNLGFRVERLEESGNWQSVGFVNSRADGGNSNIVLNYQFSDPNHLKTVTRYRLRQIDRDGRSELSEIRQVLPDGDRKNKIIVYPNPTTDGKINVVFDETATRNMSVIDMSGRIVKQIKGITGNTIQVDNLAPGMYSLVIVDPHTGKRVIEKVVVNK